MDLQGADADPGSDPDSDSLLNVFEFAFVGDPRTAEPGLRADLVVKDDGYLHLEFPFRKQASAFGLAYRIEETGDP